MKANIKIITAAVTLAGSLNAWSAMSGLSVRSHLGQPFSGSITVTGDEAKALAEGGRVSVSGGGVRGSVVKNGNGSVTVRLRSSSPIHEPVLSFTVSAGSQTREYTAILDPVRYTPAKQRSADKSAAKPESKKSKAKTDSQAPATTSDTKVKIEHDFIGKPNKAADSKKPQPSGKTASKPESKPSATRSEERKPAASHEPAAAPTPKKPSKTAVTPRRHRAHAGERLADIAARYRPRNMSQQTAMRALVLANPRAFRHGTTVRRNVTLYIPTESQWHVYAQRAQQQSAASVQAAQPPVRRTAPKVSGNTAGSTAPVHSTPSAPPPQQPVQQQPAQQDNNTQADLPPQPPQFKTPPPTQDSGSQLAVKDEAKTSAPKQADTAPPPPPPLPSNSGSDATAAPPPPPPPLPPSDVADAAASSDASMPPAASAAEDGSAAASGTAFIPPALPQDAQTPDASMVSEAEGESAEDNYDWVIWPAAGVSLAAVLGGGAYALLRRRRKNSGSSDDGAYDDEDDVQWEEEPVKPKKKKTKGKKKDAEQENEYEVDDNVSAAAKGAAAAVGVAAAATAAADEFADDFALDEQFDLNALEKTESFDQAAVSEEPVQDVFGDEDDWSWLEGNGQNAASSPAAAVDDEFASDDWALDNSLEDTFTVDTPAQPAAAETDSFDLDGFNADDLLADNEFIVADDISDLSADSNDNLDSLAAAALNDLDTLDNFEAPALPAGRSGLQTQQSDASGLDEFNLDALDGLDGLGSNDGLDFSASFDESPAAKPQTAAKDDFGDVDLDALSAFAEGALADGNDGLDFSASFDEAPAAKPQAAAKDNFGDVDLDALSAFAEGALADNNDGLDFSASFDEAPVSKPQAAAKDDFGDVDLDALSAFAEGALAESNDGLDFSASFDEAPAAKPQAAAKDDFGDVDLDALSAFAEGALADSNDGLDFSASFDETPAAKPQAETGNNFADMDLDELTAFAHNISEQPAATPQSEPDFGDVDLDALSGLTDSHTDDFSASLDDIPEVGGKSNDFANMDLDELTAFAHGISETEPAPSANNEADFGSFDLDALVTEPTATKAAENSNDFDLTASFDAPKEKGLETDSLDNFVLNDNPLSEDNGDSLSFDLDNDAPALVLEQNSELDNIMTHTESEPAWLSDDVNLSFSDDLPEIGVTEAAPIGDLSDLESFDTAWADNMLAPSDVGVGFVSEAVGMEEPFEAKLELAKMYLEIEDTAAARETLGELVAESSGDVKAQAERLLADLG